MKKLITPNSPEHGEYKYREGYSHGYSQALNSLTYLMGRGYSAEAALALSFEFMQQDIQNWRNNIPLDSPEPPPSIINKP